MKRTVLSSVHCELRFGLSGFKAQLWRQTFSCGVIMADEEDRTSASPAFASCTACIVSAMTPFIV